MITRNQVILLGVLVASLLVCLGWTFPLNEAFLIGADDKFELNKAQFLARQPELISRLWNDQPWLHTVIIAQAFRAFGEHAAIPRVGTMLCTFGMILACWHILGRRGTLLEWILFSCFYFTSTEALGLSFSAMVEPPAMSLALLAIACTLTGKVKQSVTRPYIAGLIMSGAAWIKLTALMLGPAWLALLLVRQGVASTARMLPRLALGFLAGTLLVIIISPPFTFESIWLTHQRSHQIAVADAEHTFPVKIFLTDWTIMLPAALAVIRLFRNFRSPDPATLFALVWVVTDYVIHLWHRPWFDYYAIHFHIPLAILAARGAGWAITSAWRGMYAPWVSASVEPAPSERSRRGSEETVAGSIALCAALMVAGWFGIRFPKFWDEVKSVQAREKAGDNLFVPVIQKYADKANWIYHADDEIAFHAGVLQPPELIIMSYKRLALGSLNKQSIFEIVQTTKPDLLLLRREGEGKDRRFVQFLADRSYVRIMWSSGMDLWATPRFGTPAAKAPDQLVKDLGL